tara:strand:+ start:517 stop:3702 length:3186 start_codon:yes stop_codon:yes gene_type:complete
MAKRFAGFTPEQMGKIIPEMKGMQADEQAMFLASKPGAASRVGKMAELAQKRIGMASGGYVKRQGYATGGTPSGAPAPTVFTNDYSTPEKVAAMQAKSEPGGVFYESAGSIAAEKAANEAAASTVPVTDVPVTDVPVTGGPVTSTAPATTVMTGADKAAAAKAAADQSKAAAAAKAALEESAAEMQAFQNQLDAIKGDSYKTAGETADDKTILGNKATRDEVLNQIEVAKADFAKGAITKEELDDNVNLLNMMISGIDKTIAKQTAALQGDYDDSSIGYYSQYNPADGLPPVPEKIYTDTGELSPTIVSSIDAAFENPNWNEGTTGVNANLTNGIDSDLTWAKTSVTNNATNAAIMADPTDYELVKVGEYWEVQYPDGTSINTGHKDANMALGRANALAASFKAAGILGTQEEIDAAEAQYQINLEQYETYYGSKAGEGLTDVGASLDAAQTALSKEQELFKSYGQQLTNLPEDDPQRAVLQKLVDEQEAKVTVAKANLSQANQNVARIGTASTTEMQAAALSDPMSMVTTADTALTSDAQKADGMIAEDTGQAADEADEATQIEADISANVPLSKEYEAAGMTPKEAADEVANVMSKLTAVTGKPSKEALVDAATMSPELLAQLGLTAAQVDRAQRVEAVAPLKVTDDMLVSGAVDFERAKVETNFTAATGVPSSEATVQGQLTGLLEQFEGGETPAWAAGAMRAATATLAARGLGASSMAGQAIVQAAMESALPIAQMDAQTRASFEAQNLSNKQQAAMFAAEQRSKFLGLEFDQEFQSRVQNAARISDVARINFTAEQQVTLENARMAQTVDIANLDARQAKVMADAAAMTQLDLTNLNNRQQANVQIAQAFLDFDMTSMSNQQQVAMFKAQSLASVYTSDTAQVNAAKQFNASSSDQVDMFFSNLQNNIQQFNNEQYNAMEKFNSGEANVLSQFNASQQNSRDTFNAQNHLVVGQANAQWSQSITTTDNAALNQANREAAQAANNLTSTAYNNAMQRERDTLAWAWQSAENDKDRDSRITIAKIGESAEDEGGSALASATGTFLGALASNAADVIFA